MFAYRRIQWKASTMRLFVGLDLPIETVRNLEALLAGLRPTARINWSPPANLHITTKFVGEWPDSRLSEMKASLAGMAAAPAISVQVRRLGFFPNPHAPRVFWCGVEAPGLEALAAATDGATAALGVPREMRRFSPHLTLARIKDRVDLQSLREAVAALPTLDFGCFAASSFFLYQSSLRPTGSVYTKLAEFPLETR
jgi:RNA 2',3'-cyclic 3'-phosphodiesterase